MKKHLLLAAAALTLAAAANAKCWRINPNPNAKANFLTVAKAMDDANVQPGDTLLLDPGHHGNISLNKKGITLIGTGYLLDKNTSWAETEEAVASSVTLYDSCKVEGLHVTDHIVIKEYSTVSRCKTRYIVADDSYCHGITIEQCLLTGGNSPIPNYSSVYCAFHCKSIAPNSMILKNNIILAPLRFRYSDVGWSCPKFSYSTIENNTIICSKPDLRGENSTINNNIIIDTDSTEQMPIVFSGCDNCVVKNNVLSITGSNETYPYNHFAGASVDNTFVGEGSEDGMYQLAENSPAKNAATHGGDCGAFGGETPYILSGIPMFQPHITEAIVPKKPTDGKITVKIKLASQDE